MQQVGLTTRAPWRRLLSVVTGFLLLAGLVVLLPAAPARAATLVVNDLGDSGTDLAPGDGVCDTGGSVCTLRAAIQEANALAGADVITLPAGTITLGGGGTSEDAAADGDLDINSVITINGDAAGSTITGGTERVFHVVGASLTLNGVTVTGGADATGAGLLVDASQTATVNASTFAGNVATSGGGAMAVAGTLTVTNSTITGNDAGTGSGGGVLTIGTGSATLTSTTVTANVATVDGRGIANPGGTLTIGHTIVAANAGGTNDCSGTIATTDYNLVGAADGGTCTITPAANDQVGTVASPINPQLVALADNGGPTQTHALLAASPALDVGGSCAATDQRGFTRGAVCDAGAHEAIQANFLTASGASGEGVAAPVIAIELDGGGSDTDVTVTIADAGTGSAGGADYTLNSTSVVFGAGAASGATANVSLTITNDTLLETAETIDLTLTAVSGGFPGSGTTYTRTINDNDGTSTVDFIGANPNVAEGGDITYTVQLTLSTATALGTTVSADVIDDFTGTAGSGIDYAATLPDTVTFTPGSTSGATQQVALSTIDDDLVEGNKTIDVSLGALVGPVGPGSTTTRTTTITSEDVPGVTVTPTTATVTEGAPGEDYTLALTSQPTDDVDITVATTTGEAVTSTNLVTFTNVNWATPQPVTITAFDDGAADGTTADTITHSASSLDGDYSGVTIDSVGVTVVDDEVPVVTVVATDATAAEPGTDTGEFTVTRAGSTVGLLPVTYSIGGNATPGSDYATLSGTVNIPDGATSATILVTALDDALDEPTQTVIVTLTEGVAYDVGSPASAQVNILDDDPAPTLDVADESIVEGNAGTSTMTFTLTLDGPSGRTVNVDVATADVSATAGEDYVAIPTTTITFTPGQTVKTVDVTINGDTTAEGDETFELQLSSPQFVSLATTSATGTITNDEATPTINIADVSSAEDIAGGELEFLVTMSPPSGNTVTVNFSTTNGSAVAPGDFTAVTGGVVTFGPGQVNRNARVTIIDDAIDEDDETMTVTLSGATGGAVIGDGVATGTILDDDDPPTVSIDSPSASEGAGTLTYTLTLSGPSGKTVRVTAATNGAGTATPVDDFTPLSPTVVIFPAGITSRTVAVTMVDDDLDEPGQTVHVVLSNPVNTSIATGTGVGTILDDDPQVSVSIAGGTVDEGDGSFDLTVSLGAPSGRNIAVTVTTANAGATADDDYTAVSQVVNFAPLETVKTVPVTILEDALVEGPEDFTAALSLATNATITGGPASVTITDNDAPGISISPTELTVTEGQPGVTYSVVLLSQPTATVSVAPSVSNGEATRTPGNMNFTTANWNSPRQVTVTATDDAVFDGTTTATITHTVSSSDPDYNGFAADSVAVTIEDNETTPTVSISPLTFDEQDVDAPAAFELTITPASSTDITVEYATSPGSATAGVDYTTVPATQVVIPAESATATVLVTVKGDNLDESAETFTVTLSNPGPGATLGTSVATGTIADDDATPVGVPDDYTVDEGGALSSFSVLANDTDADDTALTAALVAGPTRDAGFTFNPDGTFDYLHDGSESTSDTFTYTATDGTNTSGTTTVTITVDPVNDVPVVDAGGNRTVDEGDTVSLAPATYDDPDPGDTHSAVVDWGDGTPLDTNTVVNQGANTVSASHIFADNGVYVVTVDVSDSAVPAGQGSDSFNVTVNNAPPVAVINGAPATSPEGTTIELTATADDPGADDTHTFAWSVTKNGSPYGSGTDATFTFTPDNEGAYEVTLVATDDDGAASAPTVVTITGTNVAPALTMPGAASIAEGGTFTGTVTYTDPGADTLTATVDWGEGAGPQGIAVGATIALSHQYVEDGSYTITVCVADGTDETCETTSVTVLNSPVQITSATATPSTINEGDTVTLNVTFSDPGVNDTHTALIQWGDGASTAVNPATSPFSRSHVYVDEVGAPFTINITVTDDEGAARTAQVVVTVANADLLVDPGSTGEAIDEGGSVDFSVAIDDAGVNDTHTAVINWGDGTSDDLGSVARTFGTPTHTYPQDGSYNVLITVTDNSGDVGTATLTVVVANVAPVVDAFPGATIDEGDVYSASGTFSDVGVEDTHTAIVDYGDATQETLTLGAGTFDLSHTYADNGVFTVTVCVTDDAGGDDCEQSTVTVDNVAPVVTLVGPVNGPGPFFEGELLSFTSTVSDPGADTFTYEWLVTLDGVTVATGTSSGFSFTPADNGRYRVRVRARDDDGAADTVARFVTVDNVAPVAEIKAFGGGQPPESGNEGSRVRLTAGQQDPGDDTFTHRWTVTKNGDFYKSGNKANFTFTPNDEGTYVASLVVTDDDGGVSATVSLEVAVANVAPAPTIQGATTAVEGDSVTLTASANDPGPQDVAVYSWEVYLQGVLFASGSDRSFTFQPLDDGVYFASVVVSDDDPNDPADDAVAGSGAKAAIITVANAIPRIILIASDATPPVGGIFSMSANFSDAGVLDEHSATVDWGQGAGPQPIAVDEAGGSGRAVASHSFPNRATYTVTVCIADMDGGEACRSIFYNVGAVVDLTSDFNGDGREDLAIGVPGEDVGSVSNAGAVNVLYGRGVGIGSGPDQFWHQDVGGVPSAAQTNDAFGSALASGDFDGDGYSDLAIGVPGERLSGASGTGAVNVLRGSANGLTKTGSQFWHQGLSAIPGDNEAGDNFGATLVAGDFNGDAFADLAIGVTGERVNGVPAAGRVVVLFGSPSGLAGGAQSWDQDSPGIKDDAHPGDRFGSALAAGDFDGDGVDDLAVGVHLEDVNGRADSGAVNIIRGALLGLTERKNLFLHQSTPGISNVAEPGDHFGAALTTGDFVGDGYEDLAVGVPGESYSGTKEAGAVAILNGGSGGLSGTGDQFFVAGNSALPGSARSGARFGAALASGDFDDDGKIDVAIGTPGDLVAGRSAAGSVTTMFGGTVGLTTSRAKRFTEASPGLAGDPFGNDQFGATLRAGDFDGDGDWDLAIGIPNQNVSGSSNAGALMILRARNTGITSQGDTVWHQNTAGVKDIAEAADRFAAAL